MAREAIAGQTNGYTTTDGTKRIVVDVDLAPAQAAKPSCTKPHTPPFTKPSPQPSTSSTAA